MYFLQFFAFQTACFLQIDNGSSTCMSSSTKHCNVLIITFSQKLVTGCSLVSKYNQRPKEKTRLR